MGYTVERQEEESGREQRPVPSCPNVMRPLPDSRHAVRLVVRAFLFWVVLHAVATAIAVAASDTMGFAGALPLAWHARAAVIAVVALLSSLDARLAGEPLFHGNLGTPSWWIPDH